MPINEYKNMVNEFFEKFNSLNNIDTQNQIRILLFLSTIENKDGKTEEAIDKKLNRLIKNNPRIIQKLLPETKNGFRKMKRKK